MWGWYAKCGRNDIHEAYPCIFFHYSCTLVSKDLALQLHACYLNHTHACINKSHATMLKIIYRFKDSLVSRPNPKMEKAWTHL